MFFFFLMQNYIVFHNLYKASEFLWTTHSHRKLSKYLTQLKSWVHLSTRKKKKNKATNKEQSFLKLSWSDTTEYEEEW